MRNMLTHWSWCNWQQKSGDSDVGVIKRPHSPGVPNHATPPKRCRDEEVSAILSFDSLDKLCRRGFRGGVPGARPCSPLHVRRKKSCPPPVQSDSLYRLRPQVQHSLEARLVCYFILAKYQKYTLLMLQYRFFHLILAHKNTWIYDVFVRLMWTFILEWHHCVLSSTVTVNVTIGFGLFKFAIYRIHAVFSFMCFYKVKFCEHIGQIIGFSFFFLLSNLYYAHNWYLIDMYIMRTIPFALLFIADDSRLTSHRRRWSGHWCQQKQSSAYFTITFLLEF